MGASTFIRMRARQKAESETIKEQGLETEEEKKARLIARAKELEIKGVLSNFGIETLEKKIAEAEKGE